MKVGLITFHKSYNCGSILQAYALKKTIESLGHQCEIIDFSNDGQKRMYSVLVRPRRYKDILRDALYAIYYIPMKRHYKDYFEYIPKLFGLSGPEYHTSKELKDAQVEDKYDVLVCGSDQVWNTKCRDADDAYFLDFASHTKKVSYATSMGAVRIKTQGSQKEEHYRNLLGDFSAISVRENSAQRWIGELTEQPVAITADPTLLLDKKYFDELCIKERIVSGEYIFYYSFGYNHCINKIVKELSQKTGLPVYVMNAEYWGRQHLYTYGFKLTKHSGPDVFLSLIRDAKIVVTTSLHGSIFSSKYKKCFWYLKGADHDPNDDRSTSLLTQLGLKDRFVNREELFSRNLYEPISEDCEKHVEELVKKSLEFLKENLG